MARAASDARQAEREALAALKSTPRRAVPLGETTPDLLPEGNKPVSPKAEPTSLSKAPERRPQVEPNPDVPEEEQDRDWDWNSGPGM